MQYRRTLLHFTLYFDRRQEGNLAAPGFGTRTSREQILKGVCKVNPAPFGFERLDVRAPRF